MLAFRNAEEPAPGGSFLARIAAVLPIVAIVVSAGPLAAQGVVLPGATYVEPPGSAAAVAAARWPRPDGEALTLRVRFAEPPGGREEFWSGAGAALQAWETATDGSFRFVPSEGTGPADIEFRWTEQLPRSQAGTTHRRLDAEGYITSVRVVLARRHADGTPMSDAFRRLVAIHEVGHALGLPHSESPGDVMHPGNRNLVISARDLRSLGVLYALP